MCSILPFVSKLVHIVATKWTVKLLCWVRASSNGLHRQKAWFGGRTLKAVATLKRKQIVKQFKCLHQHFKVANIAMLLTVVHGGLQQRLAVSGFCRRRVRSSAAVFRCCRPFRLLPWFRILNLPLWFQWPPGLAWLILSLGRWSPNCVFSSFLVALFDSKLDDRQSLPIISLFTLMSPTASRS